MIRWLDALRSMLTWWVIIAPWEQGVRVRLGKHVYMLGAGLHLFIPFIDRVYRQSIRKRMSVLPAVTLTTRDAATITVSGYLSYEIVDLLKLYQTLSAAEDFLHAAVTRELTNFIVRHTREECMPDTIQDYVNAHLQLAPYGIGQACFGLSDFVVAKTYRLISNNISGYLSSGNVLTTDVSVMPIGSPAQ